MVEWNESIWHEQWKKKPTKKRNSIYTFANHSQLKLSSLKKSLSSLVFGEFVPKDEIKESIEISMHNQQQQFVMILLSG